MPDSLDIKYVKQDVSNHLSKALVGAEGLIELIKEYNEQDTANIVDFEPYHINPGPFKKLLKAIKKAEASVPMD